MNFNEIISCQNMILKTFSNIEKSTYEKNNKLLSVWKKVVTKVNGCGQNLYEHTSILDVKNGILIVETDYPGWSQLLQMNSKFILKGLQMYLPEIKINSLAYRIKKANDISCPVDYDSIIKKEKIRMEEKMKEESEKIEKFEENSKKEEKNIELPPELKDKFDSIRKSLLTKNQNK